MEDRLIVAYALAALMVTFLGVFVMRYLNTRRKFKIRQSGRGKADNSNIAD